MRHSAAAVRQAAVWLERVDLRREPRQLSRNRVFVEHALRDRSVQLWLGRAESGLCRLFVASGDRRLDLLDESPHPTFSSPVDRRALEGLAQTLFCRFVSCHELQRGKQVALYIGDCTPRSTSGGLSRILGDG